MEVASKLISSSILTDSETGEAINPLDAHFRSLRLSKMDVVNRNSTEFQVLERYTHDTHGATHAHYKVRVENAFRVERYVSLFLPFDRCYILNGLRRQDETDAWLKAGHGKLGDGERLLLWHGSRSTNFAGGSSLTRLTSILTASTPLGILKQGLRIAPPEGSFECPLSLVAITNVINSPQHLLQATCLGRVSISQT